MTSTNEQSSQLTADDRYIIAQARELAVLSYDAICARAAEATKGASTNPHGWVFGEARYLLQQLADIAERLGQRPAT